MGDRETGTAIELRGIGKSFGPGAFAIRKLDLSVDRGEIFGIIGPNGAGKTTLLKMMAGLCLPGEGEVVLFGRALSAYSFRDRARVMAYVPQESPSIFPFTVQETVLMGRYPYLGRLGFEKTRDLEAARWALEITDTLAFRDRLMGELSGGERQRVIIARALAQEADIILLDEPTSFLDIKHQVRIHDLLARLRKDRGITVISVLHDLTMAATCFDRLCLLNNGRIVESGPPECVIRYQLIKNVYDTEVYIDINSVTKRPYIIPLAGEPNGNHDKKGFER